MTRSVTSRVSDPHPFHVDPDPAVFRIRIRPDPKLFGLKDPDPDRKLSISDPDPAPDPYPSLFHTKLRNMFKKCTKR